MGVHEGWQTHTSVLADGTVCLAHLLRWLVELAKMEPEQTYFVIHAGRLDLGNEDVVGSTGDGNSLGCYLTQDTDGNTGTVGDIRQA